MNARMVHRGPDDEGVFVDSSSETALGARRLRIIDLDGGHQPVRNEDGAVWAALNGEIYNHPELLGRLRSGGHRLRSRCDTEVLVHLYEDYGAQLVHAIEGMYAFAIWDRTKRELLLVRDRFGEKPLFYSVVGDSLVFASELRALVAALPHSPELDPVALDGFYTLGYYTGERTALTGIRQLPPAHLLRWGEGDSAPRTERYWTPPRRATSSATAKGELIAEAAHLLQQSVRSRLVADVPVGVFLSGGLDSTLVATMSAAERPGALKTFSVGYDVGSVNETTAARAVARTLGTDHHEVVVSTSSIAATVNELMTRLDQPNADPALVALYALAGYAREHVTVAVGGEGADELFGGYPRYRWLSRAASLGNRVPDRLLRFAADRLSSRAGRRADRVSTVLYPRSLAERQLLWVSGGRDEARRALYGERIRDAHLSGPVAVADIASRLGPANGSPVDALMRLDQSMYLPDDVLAKADRATMLHSLEMRTPFLNRDLAEFASVTPTSVHVGSGGKALLRAVAQGPLKAPISAKKAKTAFRVPLSAWLRGPLSDVLRDQAADGALVREGWFDRQALSTAVGDHVAGRADHSAVLWPFLVAGIWLDGYRG